MNIFFLILQLLGFALPIAQNVEQLVSGAKKGQIKKQLAEETLVHTLDAVAAMGGLPPDDLAKSKRLAPKAIDLAVELLNETGVFQRSPESA